MTLWLVAGLMALPLVGLLAGELTRRRALVVVCKPLASALFVAAGTWFLPLSSSTPARLLLAGLVLSFAGDAMLIPRGRRMWFLAGLACFLCAHAAYAVAFVVHGLDARAVGYAAIGLVVVGAPLSRWLLPNVGGAMRGPVVGYVVAITAMVALAAGAYGAGAKITLLLGAVLFYFSDVTVARERFVTPSIWNGVVGLPLYYAAQILLVDGLSA